MKMNGVDVQFSEEDLNRHFDIRPPRPAKYFDFCGYTFSVNWARDYWSIADKDRAEDKFLALERIRTIEGRTYWRVFLWRLTVLWCRV
jgi:hypothetical protein